MGCARSGRRRSNREQVGQRWYKVSLAMWTYTLDARCAVIGIAKQQFNTAGAVAGSLKNYRP